MRGAFSRLASRRAVLHWPAVLLALSALGCAPSAGVVDGRGRERVVVGVAPSGSHDSATTSSAPGRSPKPLFALRALGPMHKHFAADGDGRWVPIIDQRDAGGRTRLLRTTVHPDPIRSWAMATIVAVDLSAVDLHLVAGRHEPPSETKEARAYQRAAVVPPRHHPILIAAFNGGPPAKQGGYALRIDGVTLGRPRPQSCVIAKRDDASLVIRPWDAVRHTTAKMIWFRQTPACMVDRGEQHPASSTPTYGGGTMVTRRSAIGLDDQRSVLFVGMGDYCTAQAIAEAMHHAGAQAVAPLDANFSFPKLVFYRSTGRRELEAVPLNDSFDYAEDQYVGTPAVRDFFYLTRRSAR